jgi:protein required for attachment to host cells
MKQPRTWILLADGAQARIIRQLKAEPESGERQADLAYEFEKDSLRAIMSDRPGRSFSSHDARRSAMEYRSDPVREQQKVFAGLLIADLEKRLQVGEFDRLAVIAEPRMLGLIRERLAKPLRDVVIAQIDKDLNRLPHAELVDAIDKLGIKGLRPVRAANA